MSPYWLGMMYAFDDEVPRDRAEATKWLRLGADRGNADAQFALGAMYEIGNEVKADPNEAVRWFRKAAVPSESKLDRVIFGKQLGSTPAQKALSMLYSNGYGVPKDAVEAAKWDHMATIPIVPPSDKYPNADALLPIGIPISASELADLQPAKAISHTEISEGRIRNFTPAGALEHAWHAMEMPSPSANSVTSTLPVTARQRMKLRQRNGYRRAAEHGYDVGEFRLGRCFAYASGVERDYKTIRKMASACGR